MSKKGRSLKDAKVEQLAVAKTKDKSVFVPQNTKIDFDLHIRERTDITPKQKELIDIILDPETKVVFINGPAGTSKTWTAIYCGLKLVADRRLSHITYVRTIIESASKSLGALPGDEKLKMEPFLLPLVDKLDEFLPVAEKNQLIKENRARGIPVNYLRGSSLNAQYIICDEAQNFTHKELTTAITRLGQFSKLIILADPAQSDINGKSGFMPMFDLFNDTESRNRGIHCFSFTKDDIVRSGILRYICERIEGMKKPPSEPMFIEK
jgi:phosphate starvation-inducible PhoH-like protein